MLRTSVETKKSVLIVDDDANLLELMTTLIKEEFGDYLMVVTAKDGVDALNKINHQKFQCIITDVEMPKKDGRSFVKAVRQNSYNEMTPVVIISGSETEAIESQFSFVYFMAKPFNFERLKELIDKLVEKGTIKGQLSASALNVVVSSVLVALKREMKDSKIEIARPIIANKNTSIDNKMTNTLKLRMGKVENNISIFIDQENLLKTFQSLEAAQKFNHVLINEISNELKRQRNVISTVDSVRVSPEDLLRRVREGGIIIPISVKNFSVEIFAQVVS